MGVRIDEVDRDKAQERVISFLNSNKQKKIFTPNPEMLVDALEDEEFMEILNTSDLNICDGTGLQFVGKGKLVRLSGVDFLIDICAIAERMKKSVYFLGSGDREVIDEAVKTVKRVFPNLKVAGSHPGNSLSINPSNMAGRQESPEKTSSSRQVGKQLILDEDLNNELLAEIIQAGPDILFVGFGHNKQERWIDMFVEELPSVKLVMGVGGSFDFLAGKVQRAPRWMQSLGLEWLFRLSQEPWRVKRIWKATVGFLWKYVSLRKFDKRN